MVEGLGFRVQEDLPQPYCPRNSTKDRGCVVQLGYVYGVILDRLKHYKHTITASCLGERLHWPSRKSTPNARRRLPLPRRPGLPLPGVAKVLAIRALGEERRSHHPTGILAHELKSSEHAPQLLTLFFLTLNHTACRFIDPPVQFLLRMAQGNRSHRERRTLYQLLLHPFLNLLSISNHHHYHHWPFRFGIVAGVLSGRDHRPKGGGGTF